jgi:uncharacterized membrane protein
MKHRVLLVGESWVSSATHFKGFDAFGSVTYHTGVKGLFNALQGSELELIHMPAHLASEHFPQTLAELEQYAAILISDIGANSILLHPDTWLASKPVPNRLKLLREWVRKGGNLAMFGGYLSFQGIDGTARWHRTPVEEVLPVNCLPWDDRIEIPEGFRPQRVPGEEDHPLLQGVSDQWPLLLGVNEVVIKPGARVILQLPEEEGNHPLLVTGQYGAGRTLCWTSDISPHWLPQNFIDWPGYKTLVLNMLRWLIGR